MGFTQAHPKYKNNTVEVASMVPSTNKSSGGRLKQLALWESVILVFFFLSKMLSGLKISLLGGTYEMLLVYKLYRKGQIENIILYLALLPDHVAWEQG